MRGAEDGLGLAGAEVTGEDGLAKERPLAETSRGPGQPKPV